MNLIATARTAVRPEVNPRSINSETLLHKSITVATTSTVIVLMALLLWTARTAILLIFAGIIFAVLLRSTSSWIGRQARIPNAWAMVALLFTVALLLTLGLWLRGSEIASQVDQLQQKIPAAAQQVVGALPHSAVGRWILRHSAESRQFPRLVEILPGLRGFLSSAFGLIAGLLLVLYVGITVAAEPQTYLTALEQLCPFDARPRMTRILDELGTNLRRWMLVRLASMCVVGVLISIGLSILKIPLAGTLGFFAAVMTFIPNFGPILSVLPPALLGFTISPKEALLVILLFVGVHFVEGFLLNPIAERVVVHLPPALTLSVQLLLATLCGAIGVALAAPLTLVAVVFVREVYINKVSRA
jgi:predicted PurR-regulated permease PerM